MEEVNKATITLTNGQSVVIISPTKCPCGATARRIRPPIPPEPESEEIVWFAGNLEGAT